CALRRQTTQMTAFGLDCLAARCIPASDDLVNKGAVVVQTVEVRAAAHQQCVLNSGLQVAVCALNGSVLVGNTLIVSRGRHAVMSAKRFIACRQICPGLGIQVTECSRKTVGAMIGGCAAC